MTTVAVAAVPFGLLALLVVRLGDLQEALRGVQERLLGLLSG